MNVFVVPSWYPEPRHHLLGGVFLEQAVATLARHHPEVHQFVSLWGQGDRELSLARLRAWLAHPHGLGRPRPPRRQTRANLVELYAPEWSWRHGLWRGHVDAILRRCRFHLEQARSECDRIQLLHAHVSFPAGWVAMRLSEETGIPYLVTEHMSPFPFRHLMRGGEVVPEVAEPLRRAHRVTAVSRSLARQIRERVGVEAVVVPNGVDEDLFTPGPARGDGFTFLTVAGLEPQKGIDDLLRAIARLGELPGVRFRIAGSGSRARAYRALAARLGVSRRLAWLGPLAPGAVRDEMRACDAFVLTSRHESFGVVFAEAIACGKPVLATRCGGPEDIVHEDNGLLVAVGDIAAIAAALGRLARRERVFDARAIRADFAARFGSRVVADRFAALYREMAGAA